MSDTLALAPVRLPAIMLGEIAVRLALAGFLAWVGPRTEDTLPLLLCGAAALYHILVAARLAALLLPGAAGLTLDGWGLVWRELWRERRIGWSGVVGLEATGRSRRPGVLLRLGDAKGETARMVLPDVFPLPAAALLAELQRRCEA